MQTAPSNFQQDNVAITPPGLPQVVENRHVRFKGAQEVLCQSSTETNAWHINGEPQL